MVLHTIERLYVKANPKLEGTDDLPLVPHCGPVCRYYNESDACGADWAAGGGGLGHPEAQADGVLWGKAVDRPPERRCK
jgi:hypothetical protein